MNIQLFLEGQEVELNKNVSFPLNKSYENLYNPTDILVEYSKSINIPMTAKNNRILGNVYRLDKSIYIGDGTNIGLYLNPLRRIPFKLIYNGGLLLEGYAKFVSAHRSKSNSYYTINLIGKLGDIFHELKSVVTSESKLGDLNRNYLITKEDYVDSYGDEYFNAIFAKETFEMDNPKFWDHTDVNKTIGYQFYDVFGLAPAHRGMYSNFESNKIQTNNSTIMDMSEYLTDIWSKKNPDYNITGASDIVGEGFKDYQMKEFRAYQLKPYMYFSHLMKVFVNKCKLLTGYTIDLDRDWFNFNNPYWSRLCYMFDYLDNINPNVQSGVKTYLMDGGSSDTLNDYYEDGKTCGMVMKVANATKTYGGSTDGYIIAPFDINFGCTCTPKSGTTNGSYVMESLRLMDDTFYKFDIDIYAIDAGGSRRRVGTYKFWTAKSSEVDTKDENYNKDNYLQLKGGGAGGGIIMSTRAMPPTSTVLRHYVTVPQIPLSGNFLNGIEISLITSAENLVGQTENASSSANGLYWWDRVWVNGNVTVPSHSTVGPSDAEQYASNLTTFKAYFSTSFSDIYVIEGWKTKSSVSLDTMWQKDTPLFDVILEYTKMFGLHWDIDYHDKKISLKTRKNMFKGYTIENWDSKVDRSKDFIIEPLTFSDRYAVFNYKDTDGYIYSNYRNKYGVNIGEKRINTGYEFNTSEKDLFKDIHPTSASSKSYISMKQLLSWDAKTMINPQIEPYVLLDYEAEDENGVISLNNWCFRGPNKHLDEPIYITNDSPLMLTNNTSCYYSREFIAEIIGDGRGQDADVYDTYGMPQFTIASDFYGTDVFDDKNVMGMVFNRPNEDFTYNQSVTYMGDNDIYTQCWKDYINERYNSQNKKLTGYFTFTLEDFNSFKFNKLVTIDNQLFMVNKIIDFNVDNGNSTKIELVQIQNPERLTSTTFRDRAITMRKTSNSDVIVVAYGLPKFNNVTLTGNIEAHLEESADVDDSQFTDCSVSLYFDTDTGISGDVIMTNELGEELKVTISL